MEEKQIPPVCVRAAAVLRGLLEIKHSATLTTTLISIISLLRQEEKQFNSFLLNYHTIQLSRKNTAQKKLKNNNKRTPAICVFTIKKRVELKFGCFTSFSRLQNPWIEVYWFRPASKNFKVFLAGANNSNLFFFSIFIETLRTEGKEKD